MPSPRRPRPRVRRDRADAREHSAFCRRRLHGAAARVAGGGGDGGSVFLAASSLISEGVSEGVPRVPRLEFRGEFQRGHRARALARRRDVETRSTTVRTGRSRPGSTSSSKGSSSSLVASFAAASADARVAATVTSASTLGSGGASPFSTVSGSSARSATGLGVPARSRRPRGGRTPRLGTTCPLSRVPSYSLPGTAPRALRRVRGWTRVDALGEDEFSRSETAQLARRGRRLESEALRACRSTPSASTTPPPRCETNAATSVWPCPRVSRASRPASDSALALRVAVTSLVRRGRANVSTRLGARAGEGGAGEATATCRTTGATSRRSLLGKEDSYAAYAACVEASPRGDALTGSSSSNTAFFFRGEKKRIFPGEKSPIAPAPPPRRRVPDSARRDTPMRRKFSSNALLLHVPAASKRRITSTCRVPRAPCRHVPPQARRRRDARGGANLARGTPPARPQTRQRGVRPNRRDRADAPARVQLLRGRGADRLPRRASRRAVPPRERAPRLEQSRDAQARDASARVVHAAPLRRGPGGELRASRARVRAEPAPRPWRTRT